MPSRTAIAIVPSIFCVSPAGAADPLPEAIPATVIRVIDGNTIEVSSHVWIGIAVTVRVRLRGNAGVARGFRADRPCRTVGRCTASRLEDTGFHARNDPLLLADPGFVLEPNLYIRVCREAVADFRHSGGEVFLNAFMASGSWA